MRVVGYMHIVVDEPGITLAEAKAKAESYPDTYRCMFVQSIEFDAWDEALHKTEDDEPAVFPVSVGKLPTLQDYSLRTEYYHSAGGNYADGGSSKMRYASDEEAIAGAKAIFTRGSGYHRKAILSNQTGDPIWRYQDPLPQRKPTSRRNDYQPYGCDHSFNF